MSAPIVPLILDATVPEIKDDPNYEVLKFYFDFIINKLNKSKILTSYGIEQTPYIIKAFYGNSKYTGIIDILFESEYDKSIEEITTTLNEINIIKDGYNKITITIESEINVNIEIDINDIKDIKESVKTINKFNL